MNTAIKMNIALNLNVHMNVHINTNAIKRRNVDIKVNVYV